MLCIAAIHAAVFAWEWVLITDKAFEVPLMVEMKSAWAYTVDRQYGLFSQTTRPITGALGSTLLLTCGLLAEAPQRADDPLHQLQLRIRHDQLQAHTIWIEFLTERFKVVRACNAETVNALSTIMHKVCIVVEAVCFKWFSRRWHNRSCCRLIRSPSRLASACCCSACLCCNEAALSP